MVLKIHHLRNATCVIESGEYFILVDPMLSEKGTLPPFSLFRHPLKCNPTVSLPGNARQILEKVTHCLISHSRTFGIRALQHTDHLDGPGEDFLRSKNIPVVCPKKDGGYLKNYGINVEQSLEDWVTKPFLSGEITAVPAQHGHGWNHRLMANGVGFFLALSGEPSLYISGDTVYTKDVKRALTLLKPDIAVVAAGAACLDVGPPILMQLEETLAFVRDAPGKVVANHLEALNHCPVTRSQLRKKLGQNDLLWKTYIPNDGETLSISKP